MNATATPTVSTSGTGPIEYGPPISLAEARQVALAAEAEARRHGWPMVIAVMDSGANLVVLHKMDHAQTGSIAIAQAKAESTVRFKRPTKVFEDALTQGGIHLRLLATHRASPLEGGLPLMADGRLVGAIGVSGMQSTQDAQVAAEGVKALRTNTGAPGAVEGDKAVRSPQAGYP